MYIEKIKIKNFKCFAEEKEIYFSVPNGTDNLGLNLFIGDNNTGKSTIFEALDFLRNKSPRGKNVNDLKNVNCIDDELIIEVTFSGNISRVVESFGQKNKVKIFKDYIYKENDTEKITIQRNSNKESKLYFWNKEKSEFENVAGIDGPVKKLFEFNFIWSDHNPNDEMSYGSSSITGNLLENVIGEFEGSDDYQEFAIAHQKVFNDDESSLRKELQSIEKETKDIFEEQFGSAEIQFHFEELEVKNFFKQVRVKVTDNEVETYIEEKGSGMQRSMSLALLQVYAKRLIEHPEDSDVTKPFILFIDEPEISLHPTAQLKLLKALSEISKTQQVFISTHSPFMFMNRHVDYPSITAHVFTRQDQEIQIHSINEDLKTFPWSPSWSEINYFAYDIPTIEFHNELYGYLVSEEKDIFNEKINKHHHIGSGKDHEDEKDQVGCEYCRKYYNDDKEKDEYISLSKYIRNQIHHPENTENDKFSDKELRQSIKTMIELIKTPKQNNDQK